MKKLFFLSIVLTVFVNCYSQNDSIYIDQEYIEKYDIDWSKVDTIIYTEKYMYVYYDTTETKFKEYLVPLLITSGLSLLTFYSISTGSPVLFLIFEIGFVIDIPFTFWYVDKFVWKKKYIKIKLKNVNNSKN